MYLTKPQLHVSASCVSLMIVYIRKSKHVVEVVKYTRYTSRTLLVSTSHMNKHTNGRTARRQMASITVGPQLQATDKLKNYSFWPEKLNCTLACLLFVVLLMTEWVWTIRGTILAGRTTYYVLGEKPFPVPRCSPQISHGLEWYWT